MRPFRLLTAAAAVATLLPMTAAPAAAAPPSNDTFDGAEVVNLGDSRTLDTTEATTDADDDEANAMCGAPATDASVWYSLTPTADVSAVVDVSDSDYSAGVIVVTGSPGSFELVTCGPGGVSIAASTGTTYSVLAFDDQIDGGGNGGTLEISFVEAPPPPTLDVAVDPVGHFDARTGTATITGSFACTGEPFFVDIFGDLTQSVGRFAVQGFFFSSTHDPVCDGTEQPWSAEVEPQNGSFAGGQAATVVFGFACGPFDCGHDEVEQQILLRGGPR